MALTSTNDNSLILVVEDDDLHYSVVEKALLKSDYRVIRAIDGAEAVDVSAKQLPDLIIMDLRLPKVDGWHAAKQIRLIKQLKSIPILAITAEVSFEDEHEALESGCNDYIRKPVDYDEFLSKVHVLLAGSEKRVS